MASGTDDLDSENTSINITPLVDIMLVLLIIFMVTANMQQKKTVDVHLPKMVSGQDVAMKGENLSFSIDKNSQIFLNGIKVTTEEIETKINAIQNDKINFQVSIAADETAPHGVVMKLIDTMRKYKVYDFSLDVESR